MAILPISAFTLQVNEVIKCIQYVIYEFFDHGYVSSRLNISVYYKLQLCVEDIEDIFTHQ